MFFILFMGLRLEKIEELYFSKAHPEIKRYGFVRSLYFTGDMNRGYVVGGKGLIFYDVNHRFVAVNGLLLSPTERGHFSKYIIQISQHGDDILAWSYAGRINIYRFDGTVKQGFLLPFWARIFSLIMISDSTVLMTLSPKDNEGYALLRYNLYTGARKPFMPLDTSIYFYDKELADLTYGSAVSMSLDSILIFSMQCDYNVYILSKDGEIIDSITDRPEGFVAWKDFYPEKVKRGGKKGFLRDSLSMRGFAGQAFFVNSDTFIIERAYSIDRYDSIFFDIYSLEKRKYLTTLSLGDGMITSVKNGRIYVTRPRKDSSAPYFTIEVYRLTGNIDTLVKKKPYVFEPAVIRNLNDVYVHDVLKGRVRLSSYVKKGSFLLIHVNRLRDCSLPGFKKLLDEDSLNGVLKKKGLDVHVSTKILYKFKDEELSKNFIKVSGESLDVISSVEKPYILKLWDFLLVDKKGRLLRHWNISNFTTDVYSYSVEAFYDSLYNAIKEEK